MAIHWSLLGLHEISSLLVLAVKVRLVCKSMGANMRCLIDRLLSVVDAIHLLQRQRPCLEDVEVGDDNPRYV